MGPCVVRRDVGLAAKWLYRPQAALFQQIRNRPLRAKAAAKQSAVMWGRQLAERRAGSQSIISHRHAAAAINKQAQQTARHLTGRGNEQKSGDAAQACEAFWYWHSVISATADRRLSRPCDQIAE